MWDFPQMGSRTTTRPTTAGSVLTTAKLSTFLRRPIGGCLLATDIPDAEAALEAMLQKHKDDPFEFEPHSRRCQAECWALCTHTFTASSTKGRIVTEPYTWYGGKLAELRRVTLSIRIGYRLRWKRIRIGIADGAHG